MPDYKNGKIYVIKSNETENVYIGSTCSSLTKRMSSHKSDYKRRLKGDKFKSSHSYEILKYADAYIELIENFECKTKRELLDREGVVTKNIPNCVNITIQGRTMKQYREDNVEKLKQQSKEYREKNKDMLREKQKKWRKGDGYKKYREKVKAMPKVSVNCPKCNKPVLKSSMWLHKQSEKCKSGIKYPYPKITKSEQDRIYRQQNKAKIEAMKNRKLPCPKCDKLLSASNLNRHVKNQHIE